MSRAWRKGLEHEKEISYCVFEGEERPEWLELWNKERVEVLESGVKKQTRGLGFLQSFNTLSWPLPLTACPLSVKKGGMTIATLFFPSFIEV